MKPIKRALIDRFWPRVFPTKLTKRKDLLGLIDALRPLATEHPLTRLGPAGDGGYLVPDDLEGLTACFSPGVSTSSGFELACAERGMKVYLADHSVDGPASEHSAFHFTKKFVGATTSDTYMTMAHWVRQTGVDASGDLMLQMDIEGHEYETILSAPDELLGRCRVIVIEFHRLHQLWSLPFFRVAGASFRKLLQTHACVHLHPNNCRSSIYLQGLEIPRVMEFTFLRRDRISRSSFATRFPHPLDADNTGNAPLPLPACWYPAGS